MGCCFVHILLDWIIFSIVLSVYQPVRVPVAGPPIQGASSSSDNKQASSFNYIVTDKTDLRYS